MSGSNLEQGTSCLRHILSIFNKDDNGQVTREEWRYSADQRVLFTLHNLACITLAYCALLIW